jgi:dihydroorotate dehydrogenase
MNANSQRDFKFQFQLKIQNRLRVPRLRSKFLIMDLSVQLGKIRLKNPLICASCEFTMTAAGIKAALDAGAGAVIAKSVNESPEAARQLSQAEYVLLNDDWQVISWDDKNGQDASLFCRSGMAQSPLDEWLRMLVELDGYARSKDSYVVGSITVAAVEPAAEIAARMEAAGLRWIELNLSAPHGREAAGGAVRQITASDVVAEYVRRVRRVVRAPLAVKLTAQTDDPVDLAKVAIAEGADMLVLMGRTPGFMPDIETQKPVLGSSAAIGGRWALPATLYWISKCWRNLSREVPIIGTNGARYADDVVRFLLSGARAVEMASVVMTNGPQVFRSMISDLEQYCERKKLTRLEEIIGRAADAAASYAELPVIERSAYPWDRFTR